MKTLQKLTSLIVISALFLGLSSCGNDTKTSGDTQLNEADIAAELIEGLQEDLAAMEKTDPKTKDFAKSLEDLYLEYSVSYKKDPRVPEYLYEAAQLNEYYLENFDEAFAHYSSLTDDFPESPQAQQAIFMKGMIMSEHYQKCDKATYYFDEFIRKYPEHELVNMAKDAIEVCGMSADEIFKRIQEKDS